MAIGIRLVAVPPVAAAHRLNPRPEAPPTRVEAGKFSAGIDPHPLVQPGASPVKATTFGKTRRRRTTWFPPLTRSLMFMAQWEILSPEIPGFGRARRFPQVPGSPAVPRLAIELFQVHNFRIILEASTEGVDLAIRSTASVGASGAGAGIAVSDSVLVGGRDGVLDLAGPGSATEVFIGTIHGGAGRDTVTTGILPGICMEGQTQTLTMTHTHSRMLETIRTPSLPKTI